MISLSKHCPMLGILKLNDNNMISTEWCHHVQMKQLRVLDLSRCGVNETVCVSLMISLSKHCPLLRILKLNDNNLISNEWCRHVQMKQLSTLYLSNCGISDTVCVSLMISLSKHCHLLEVLNLSGNSLTSDEWCHHVQMRQLRELYLSKCCINDTACVSLMKNLNYHCPLLEALDLSFNKLSSSGVFAIVDPIKHMNLRWLRLRDNPCMEDRQCREEVEKALQKSNPGLRIL